MSNLEHYFENLLYHGEDIKGEANKNALTEEQQKTVEQCAQYVIYSLFGTREHFDEWINRDAAPRWHRVELEEPTESGWYLVMDVDGDFNVDEWHNTFGWQFVTPSDADRITYWMPIEWMPIEPPKEDA